MGKKGIIITIVAALVSFTVGFFVGDSSAINRVNKVIGGSIGAGNTVDNSKGSVPASTPEVKEFKVGDTIDVGGKYTFTITKVALTKERNQFADQKVEKVAVINYTYKNVSSDEDLYISELNFKVYDEAGNVLDTYPAGVSKMPQNISKGKQCAAQMAYGFNDGSKLELQFYDNMFNGRADAKILVDVK